MRRHSIGIVLVINVLLALSALAFMVLPDGTAPWNAENLFWLVLIGNTLAAVMCVVARGER